ncbi:hypothetical protein ACOSQ2_005246 [Xanthoceras sorbifolium]
MIDEFCRRMTSCMNIQNMLSHLILIEPLEIKQEDLVVCELAGLPYMFQTRCRERLIQHLRGIGLFIVNLSFN